MRHSVRLSCASILAVCLSCTAIAQDEHARWPVKTSLAGPITTPVSVSFSDLAAFPLPPQPHKSSAKGDSTYQAQRYPAFTNPLNLQEGALIQTRGYLHLVASEGDGDYHSQISDSPTDGDHCVIVEVPNSDEGSAELQPKFGAVRDFIQTKLLNGKGPSSSGNVMRRPPYVEVVGQLFLDDWHLKQPPRGKKSMHAATLWEIHPVIGIRFVTKP